MTRIVSLARILLLILAALSTHTIASAGSADSAIWLTDLDHALGLAKQEDRYIVVFFYKDSDPVSKRMWTETMMRAETRAAFEDWSRARIEASGEEGREQAMKRNILRFPTVVFLDSQGRELDRFSGYADFRTLLERALEAIDPKTNYVLLKERLKKNPKDVEALYYMGYKYTRRDDYERAAKFFVVAEELDPDNEQEFADNIAVRRAEQKMRELQFEEALAELKDFHSRYPESDEQELALFLQARLHWLMRNNDRAEEKFMDFLRRFPDSEHALAARAGLEALKSLPPPSNAED